jgi:exodeoxyribonuclease III
MRLVTWNVNSLKARLERVEEWIELNEPDVLCLQETKLAQDAFPHEAFAALGYDSVHHGEGRWNGVAIISRVGLEEPTTAFGLAELDHEARLVAATCAGVRVFSCYVPNGRSLDDDHYRYKLRWLDELAQLLGSHPDDAAVVAAGDFNIAPSDVDVWDPSALEGQTHVSPDERRRLDDLASLGFEDVCRCFLPEDKAFSWWDYRGGAFHKGHGLRIDLVYASPALSARATGASIDREARKTRRSRSSGEDLKPSDHAPVVVEFD